MGNKHHHHIQQQPVKQQGHDASLDIPPPPNAEREPMLLLDTTGSMQAATAADDETPRHETIREAIGIIVAALGKEDSQAANEQDSSEEGGGLRTVTFAGGKAHDLGDLNPENYRDKWAKINWEGNTQIMPGWKKLEKVYIDEFGKKPVEQRPALAALIITDGEALDTDQFANALNQIKGRVFVTLAIIGFGKEHDVAVEAYKKKLKQSMTM